LDPLGAPSTATALIARARTRALLRLEQVCAPSGLGARALQDRLGLPLEASEQLRGPRPQSLAVSLGYVGQAHFARDFKLTVGRSPEPFARG
jgi:AraC-like DNA-binding protein